MADFKLTVPVVFCTFKRLDTAKQVFEKIRMAKPEKLYLVSDAPRASIPGEKEKVEEVHQYIESHIDWECQVHKNYASENMGCGKRIYTGITWAFETEEQAIILEDDCVPDPTFFRYCQEMLEHYKDDERILMIGGNNPIEQMHQSEHEYLFSHVPFMWGWATWKRAWDLYDYRLESWPQNRKNPLIKKAIPVKKAYYLYTTEFDVMHEGKYDDVWDYQFMYAGIINSMYGILPTKSHVKNIGFIEESTHTKDAPEWINHNVSPVTFPIRYRETVEWDRDFDEKYMSLVSKQGYIVKIKKMLGLDINCSIMDIFRRK